MISAVVLTADAQHLLSTKNTIGVARNVGRPFCFASHVDGEHFESMCWPVALFPAEYPDPGLYHSQHNRNF